MTDHDRNYGIMRELMELPRPTGQEGPEYWLALAPILSVGSSNLLRVDE